MEFTVVRGMRHWWVFVLRGLLFITAGIYMLLSPASSYAALGFFFGLIIFVAGVGELLHATGGHHPLKRRRHLLLGIIDLILGLVLMAYLVASMDILRVIVGLWFLFRGISLVSFSWFLGRSLFLIIGGILTAIFGLLIIFNGVFGSLTIIIFMSIALLVSGLFNVLQGWLMKIAGMA